MTSVYNRRHPATDSSATAVRYTPCAKGDQTDEEELEEIAVVSRDTLSVADENEQSGSATANGPRVLPSPTLYHTPSDRTKLIGKRLSAAGKISVSSPVYSGKVVEQKSRSTSKTSLLEIVSQKLDRVRGRKTSSHHSKEEVAFINKAAHLNDVMTPREIRKARRKEIQEKFGKRRGTKFEKVETSTTSSDRDSCKWTFVFDPSGRLAYWWSLVISMAFLYNFWVIIYRFAFDEICAENMALWFTCDYLADLLYILDIAFHFRTGYLEDGVLQTDSTKLRLHYLNSTMFYIDCLCLLPLDFLYLSIGFKSMLRCFRLVKIYRFWTFLDRTERHTNYPNVVRTVTLLHYLFAIYHWNACLIHLGYKHALDKYTTDGNMGVFSSYLNSLYWSTLTLTTIGELPTPTTKGEIMFVILEFVFGLLLFSTILGHVANIVTSISAARKDFQAKLDIVKTYMSLRRVPLRLQDRVIRWFDYLWMSKKSWDEEKALCLLPDKLKAEIALHVHLDTLRRVEIFQNTEAGFLCELVLKLRPVLFSPGDYICRKGEVGKEMYIVNRGRLQVVADNGKTVLATLRPGSYFGEISILNMGNEGNRRTASVRSVGYSDLFCLSKNDLWEVLKEYPAARVRLEAIAVKRLEKYKKAPLEKASISRSKSTPGLIESTGKVPLEIMQFHRHHTLPASLITPKSSCRGSHGSLDSRALGSDGSAPSRRTTSNDSHTCQTTMGESVSAATGPDQIDNSHTVSSITSFADDGSLQKSSMMTASTQSAFSPPLSPNVTLSSTVPTPSVQVFSSSSAPPRQTFSFPKPSTSGLGHSSRGPSVTSALTRPRTNVTSGSGSAQGKGTLPALPPPPSCTTPALSLPPMSASQSMLILSAPPSNIPPSSSLGSLTRDPSNDILLQEIQRLRERLVQLETENASMSLKLNQQQWEVEHRLAEIEMHICGSDSAASQASDERPIVNRESII